MTSPARLVPIVCAIALAAALSGCAPRPSPRYAIESPYGVDDPQFRRAMGAVLGPPMVDGNSVAELINGEQIFPALLDAIRGAERTITLETYIYWSDDIGRQFTDALAERARAGVRVHLILDAIGSRHLDDSDRRRLTDAGAQVELLRPILWYDPRTLATVNHRTHRRLLVIDGRIGFTGGAAIADMWKGNGQSEGEWRDSHYRFEGPVVAQLQAAFMDNWTRARGVGLYGEHYFPELAARGDAVAQVVCNEVGAPGRSADAMRLTFLMAIAGARSHIRLSCAYFFPDRTTLDAIKAARRRGVEVDIILPGKIMDVPAVRQASRATWGHLFRAGVRVYEYQPAMYHCKVVIIDDRFVSVGTSNIDPRSFELNDEVNVNVLSQAFATRQIEIFERDRANSVQITYQAWKRRPLGQRIGDGFATLLGKQL